MKRVFLVGVMAVAMAFGVSAQLLWKVEKTKEKENKVGDGVVSYLLGTHHFAPVEVLEGVAGFKEAFEGVEQVCGEVVMEEMAGQEVAEVLVGAVVMPGDTTLQMLYCEEDYAAVAEGLKELLGVDVALCERLKPAVIANQLEVAMAMKAVRGFDPELQIDGWLQQEALREGKRVVGLETPEFQIGLMVEGQSLERQARMLLCAVVNAAEAQEQIAELTQAYMNQDIEGLEAVATTAQGNDCDMLPEEEARLISDRNRRWVEAMPAIMERGATLFAVGAAHLIGPDGLINLLRAQGYTVEPVR